MGGHTVDTSARAVHRALRLHPNFEFPETPRGISADDPAVREAIQYAVETVATYVSPTPKVEGEDDELECYDVATAIREYLLPEILHKLRAGGR
jgi:hypothetical protein